jgi:hypothetical protein
MDYTGLMYFMIGGIIAVLGTIIDSIVIPTESTEENKPLLWGILRANLLFSFV